MKRSLLSFVTVFVLIPCIAQQTPASTNLRPLTPCPPWDPIDPVSQVICTGSKVVFTASVAYFETYGSWEMSSDNGLTWQPGTGNTTHSVYGDILTIPITDASMNGYLFRCVYDSICEDIVITNAALLSVINIPLAIISQPVNITACKNYPVNFAVSALGSSLTYQWQISTDGGSNFTNMNGKTTPALHFDSVFLAMNNYRYRCIITSECSPAAITDAALLTVKDEAVAIVTQPTNQFACMGDSVVFTVAATGNNLGYQWLQWNTFFADFSNIGGANAPTLIAAARENVNVYYRCAVTSSCKTLYSYSALAIPITLPVMDDAEIKYLCSGEQVYLGFGYAEQEQLYNYQWQISRDGGLTFNDIAGEIFSYLHLTANVSNNNLIYRCHVSNNCFDGYSNFKSVKADVPVSITAQPQSKNVCAGFPASFSVKTIGCVSQYQWLESHDGDITFTDLFVGTGPELKINFANTALNNYQYRCRMTSNCFGTVYSDAAILNVFDSPSAPNDTATEVLCDSCKTNIASLFNTSGFASTSWGNTDSSNVGHGRHKLKVFNAAGCYDSAYAYVNVHDADTLRICRNAFTHFHCDIPGSVYQWQINTGTGFTDAADGGGITGSATPDITLQYINSVQIRCKVDNTFYSDTTFVKETAYWTGNADSDWDNPLNWSCGDIPIYYYNIDVIILANTPHTPEVKRNTACYKLILKPGASIIIQPGYNLYITGVN